MHAASQRLRSQIGHGAVTHVERIGLSPLKRLQNAVPLCPAPAPAEREPIRSTAHWLYHHECDILNRDEHYLKVGVDGNPVFEGLTQCRRMWAGGSFEFKRAMRAGDTIRKTTRIVDVTEKTSAIYGDVLFVARESILVDDADGAECLVERVEHVYLPNVGYIPPKHETLVPEDVLARLGAQDGAGWERQVEVDAVSLFRYSALTQNSHRYAHEDRRGVPCCLPRRAHRRLTWCALLPSPPRSVHYDEHYATQCEGYPSVVVHGPMLCTLMLDLFQRGQTETAALATNGADPDLPGPFSGYRFSYRAVRPLFLGSSVCVLGEPGLHGRARLWATNGEGHVCMQAAVEPLPPQGP
jgi:3-methylfumaryl-CoA hydratase